MQLPRDAYQQAEQGAAVNQLQHAEKGDLAFFHNDKGRVTHVGILMNATTIIHAAGKVRIDPIDAIGIVNSETGVRTHQLHSIRRFTL
jgi:cell wall-associated NlpC family hydrolase